MEYTWWWSTLDGGVHLVMEYTWWSSTPGGGVQNGGGGVYCGGVHLVEEYSGGVTILTT